ncbi:MAG TPA: hypothetical protein VJK29_22820 [Terriglobales bacterium]|nr:hypothetical protein [Terriglobales bacterium]
MRSSIWSKSADWARVDFTKKPLKERPAEQFIVPGAFCAFLFWWFGPQDWSFLPALAICTLLSPLAGVVPPSIRRRWLFPVVGVPLSVFFGFVGAQKIESLRDLVRHPERFVVLYLARSELAPQIHETTTSDQLDVLDAFTRYIKAQDPSSGHYWYFAGEIARRRAWLNRSNEPAYLAGIGESEDDFFKYLDYWDHRASRHYRDNEDCYTPTNDGYCAERTAWISNLLANDFYRKGQLSNNPDDFRHAKDYIECTFTFFSGGFVQANQEGGLGPLIPTKQLRDLLGAADKPGKCPHN